MIIDRFEESVRKYKNKIAIKSSKKSLTFGELNRMVNRVARKLITIDNQVGFKANEHTVALIFDHGIDMIIALLAVLKASKVYVPLNITYPKKRLEYMIKHSEANIIVTNNRNISIAEELAIKGSQDIVILNIEDIDDDISSENLNLEISGQQMAYLLYTSGSTGKPKAVMQTHRNILYFIEVYTKNLCITSKDNMTLFSYFSHDAAVMDIYGALLNGASLFPKDIRKDTNISLLPRWIEEQEISIWHSVPTLYRYFSNILEGSEEFSKLRYIVLGGEPVIKHDIDIFNKFMPNATLYNLYGQTESSYNAGQYIYSSTNVNKITLGNVNEGTDLMIINEEGEEVEEFGIGEILVISDHIALGYWKDTENTSKAFLYDSQLGRIYRTGDIGKIDYDGSIEYIGRIDNQVKIRGYRIEPGEIESCLLKHEEVKEAVVLAKKDRDGNSDLYGYIVGDSEITRKSLKAHLSRELPDYMIPSYFVQLEEMPLTPNGKIDRRPLKELDANVKTGVEYEEPRNEIEVKLVEIWKKVLKVDRIGINDNFFELGGHSLKATDLTSRIHKELEIEMLLLELFKRPTIKQQSEYLQNSKKSMYSSIKKVDESQQYILSSAQSRMYILSQLAKNSINYNMPAGIEIKEKVDKEYLEKIFKELIKRHESLRTSFKLIKGEPRQRIEKEVEFEIEIKMAKEEEIEEIIKSFVRPFDLNKAPLLRVALIEIVEDKSILLVDIHHIISDGTSIGILMNEFMKLYRGEKLEDLNIQYKDYAVWQRNMLESEEMKRQEKYWLEKFEGEIPVLDMSTDYPRSAVRSYEGDIVSFKVGDELTEKLKKIAVKTQTTIFMVLMAGYNVLVHKYTGQEDIIIGSPVAGRPHSDLKNIIGMFVNMMSLRNYLRQEDTFNEFLKEVKRNLLDAYDNQDYQFQELVRKLNIRKTPRKNPLFDIVFAMQNSEFKDIEVGDAAFTNYSLGYAIARFDLTLFAIELNDEVHFNLRYSKDLFKKETIERLANHYVEILEQVVENIDIKIKEIEISVNVLFASSNIEDDDFDF